MPPRMSRAQRQAAFLEEAVRLYDRLENWYDQHPDATFGEIEAEARKQRRTLMGRALALLINGRDSGYPVQPPNCPGCGQPMQFQRYRTRRIYGLEGDTQLSRAYYACRHCKRQTFFPPRL